MNDWELLGIEPTDNVTEIKKAFAKKLKQCRPEDDAELYQKVRKAYENIIKNLKNNKSDLQKVINKLTSISQKSKPEPEQKTPETPPLEKLDIEVNDPVTIPKKLNSDNLLEKNTGTSSKGTPVPDSNSYRRAQEELEQSQNKNGSAQRTNKPNLDRYKDDLNSVNNTPQRSRSSEINMSEIRRIQSEIETKGASTIDDLLPQHEPFILSDSPLHYSTFPGTEFSFNVHTVSE